MKGIWNEILSKYNKVVGLRITKFLTVHPVGSPHTSPLTPVHPSQNFSTVSVEEKRGKSTTILYLNLYGSVPPPSTEWLRDICETSITG